MNDNMKNTHKQYGRHNYCTDNHVYITDNFDAILQYQRSIEIEAFTFIYCESGKIDIELNNSTFHLYKNDLIVCFPNSTITLISEKDEQKLIIIRFSNRFVHRLTQTEKGKWRIMEHLHTHPIKHLNKDEHSIFKKYLDLISYKTKKTTDKYQRDILMYIASAMFEEMIAEAYKNSYEEENKENSLRQSDYIFNNFMEAVTDDKGRHRTIGYYAEMLCYTPKYLSTIVKKVCGKNALTLINENAIENIIAELKYSDKNIKQIAFDFNFSNNSFFSKFFKLHTGISPTEYRNNIIKDQDGNDVNDGLTKSK